MRSTGHYSRVEDDFDLDHEITHNIKKLDEIIESIDCGKSFTKQSANKNKVLRELASHILEKLEL